MEIDQMRKWGLGARPDYSDIANIKTEKEKEEEKRYNIINGDLKMISDSIESEDREKLLDVHRKIDARYQSSIPDWGKSCFLYNESLGYDYEGLEKTTDTNTIIHNLKIMKGKLEAFRDNLIPSDYKPTSSVSVAVNNMNENHNNNDIDISFELAKQKIEDMPGLDQAATEELQEKVDELEKINRESLSPKRKWEKAKKILHFAIDKGADVAIMFMSLVMQMKLNT